MFYETAKPAETGRNSSRWAYLPGLCCQAAGGDPLWADEVAAAWLLFYKAAHLMDHVEDQDAPDSWWEALGPGAAINAASGLFFTASLVLNDLHRRSETQNAAVEVTRAFHMHFLGMCSGQHADLANPRPILEQYWETAAAKSGAFFSLACFAGARLACAEPARLQEYSRFGQYVGVLIQVLDDLEDIQFVQNFRTTNKTLDPQRSLPVVYAMQVLPPAQCGRLQVCLQAGLREPEAAREALDWLERSGAGLYLLAEIARHRSLAQAALEKAHPQPAASAELQALLNSLIPE